MGYWGWRRLAAVFVSVWVVGCTITHDAAPTAPPTPRPQVTLTIYASSPAPPLHFTESPFLTATAAAPREVVYPVQAGDSLLNIARRFGVDANTLRSVNNIPSDGLLQIGQALRIPQPQFDATGLPILPTATPLYFAILAPRCSMIPTDSMLCLGEVSNPLSVPLARVAVGVRLRRADGRLAAEGITSMEQIIIAPGQAAPYRLLFKGNWQEPLSASAFIASAESAPHLRDRFVPVQIEQENRQAVGGQHIVSAIVSNQHDRPARLLRAVVTLRDVLGRPSGYRVVELNRTLLPGERWALVLAVSPQLPGFIASHTLYIEAERG
jgi:LysM repeat protein